MSKKTFSHIKITGVHLGHSQKYVKIVTFCQISLKTHQNLHFRKTALTGLDRLFWQKPCFFTFLAKKSHFWPKKSCFLTFWHEFVTKMSIFIMFFHILIKSVSFDTFGTSSSSRSLIYPRKKIWIFNFMKMYSFQKNWKNSKH